MELTSISHQKLLELLYQELKAEGAVMPEKVVEKFLTDGQISSLFNFEKMPAIQYEGYSKVKSEILQRNRFELKEAFRKIAFN